MAFVHGKNTKVLVNQYDLSGFLNNVDLTWECDTPESTVFGVDDRTYIVGLRGQTMSFSGLYAATSSAAIDAVVPTDLGNATAKLVTYASSGFTVGNRCYSSQVFYTSYGVSSPVDGIVSITLDVQGSAKLADAVSLHNLTAVSSDGNSAAVNLSANTSSGGVGYLHITAIQGLPATGFLALTVQDSPTCTAGSWADLVTFTNITSNTVKAERATATGNVDQYVRGEWDFNAATTAIVTFVITFDQI
jgi:hypothetical protein